jgi:hypothetical protein
MLNRSGGSGHPCLIPDFRGNGFSISPLDSMLAIVLSYSLRLHQVLHFSFFGRLFIVASISLYVIYV